jgi:hypothetical protein
VSEPQDNVDARLKELGTATDTIRARAGFADLVMNSIQREPIWPSELLRSARRLLPVAALAAVLSLVWSKVSTDSANEVLAASDEIVEIEW